MIRAARRGPSWGVALLASAVGLALASGAPAAAGPQRVAATSGCQAVGGGSVGTGGGPHRATVVVDTGSGPVWSACISFSGTISGIEALERAKDVITDLDPVYDQYTGLGRAVCRLRSVGSDPPDCLGKAPSYWSYSQGGRVVPVGAGATSVEDGGVEGWRYGSGGTPRTATAGTRAVTAPATTTTTRPTATTQPQTATTAPPRGGLTGNTVPGGAPAPSTTAPAPGRGSTTTVPGTTTSPDASSTTAAPAAGPAPGEGTDGSVDGGDGAGGSGQAESAAAAASGSASAGGADGGSGGSGPIASVAGFAAVIAVIAGGSVLVRRRRLAAQHAVASA